MVVLPIIAGTLMPVRATRNVLNAVPAMAMASAVCAQTERLACAGGDSVSTLSSVVKPLRAHRRRLHSGDTALGTPRPVP
jgi:hypothetical protein